MLSSKKTLIKRSAVRVSAALLTLMTTSAVAAIKTDAVLLAQSPVPTSFPLPSAVPSGTTVKLDGSSSMTVINEALKKSFEEKFSGTTVNLATTGTDDALQSLLKGNIDLAAIGRPLTDEEKAQGLTETTLSREKVAIIVSPENPFSGNITFDQFAKMFRGEITDWSELGGEPGPIRFIDRPDFSDTRISLSKYDVFLGTTFATGSNATQEAKDETAAVVQDLGKDGISYAIASQVLDQPNVKIISMHKTLPDDPRYPFSQPRGYAYKDAANPAVLAFLGFATSPAGLAAISTAKATEAAAVAAVAPSPVASPDLPPSVTPEAVSPEASPAIAVATGATAEPGGFPGWLGWLLLPLIGGGLWWLFRGRDAAPTAVVPPPIAPPVVPPAPAAPLPVPPPVESPAAIPSAVIPAVIPAVGAAAGAAALGAVALGAGVGAGRRSPDSRIILTPRDSQNAYAYWEAPEEHRAELREQGGRNLKLRVSDVTDIDLDHQPAHSVQEFDCSEAEPDLHVPIPQCDRDYISELGYVTDDNRWLKLARSHSVRVACEPVKADDGLSMSGLAGGAALTAVAVAGAVAAMPSETVPLLDPATVVDDSRVILTPRTADDAYAYWEAPEVSKAALREQGGTKFQLRVYDATDIELDHHPAHSLQVYDLQSSESDHHVSIPTVDRDYVAEIGYETIGGNWLKLARSNFVRIGADLNTATVAEGAAVGASSISGLAPSRCSTTTLKVHSQRNCFFLDASEMNKLQLEKAVSKVLEPGQYLIRIKEGGFGYVDAVGEPVVMLWIYGGKVVNQKTNAVVGATWSTLNGYDETLNLQVHETANLCCFFFDTHLEDNQGEVTVSVVKI